MMYGEKVLEYKIVKNKIIKVSEFKKIKYDFSKLINKLSDYIKKYPSDDTINLFYEVIFLRKIQTSNSFEVDLVLNLIKLIFEEKENNGLNEKDQKFLLKNIKILEKLKGYEIYLKLKPI